MANQVAEQLSPLLAARLGSLPDNEITAALLAVEDVLMSSDLTDAALLNDDADPEKVARRIRAQFPDQPRKNLLSPKAASLYETALDQSVRYLIQVIRYLPSFQPAALAEVLARLTTQADKLDHLLQSTPTTTLYAPTGTDHDTDFRDEYFGYLSRTLDRLELLGLPGDDQPTLALTVAYLSLSVASPGEDYPGALPGPLSVERAIGGHSRVLLRGEAGSGKTTLLHWLAVRAARRELTGPLAEWNGRVPFLIRLRAHDPNALPAPEAFVRDTAPTIANLMPPGWAHRHLRDNALLLVDGVDEVPQDRRPLVRKWLRSLLATFPGMKVVVTARTAAATRTWLSGERFHTVTLEPMAPASIREFTRRWHEAAPGDTSAAETRLQNQLERPHLRELASSPLLCAMLCGLNLAHRSELPRNRMELYAKALAMLLHFRDAERGIPALLSNTEKQVVLRDLAWRLTLAGKVEMSTRTARDHVARKLPNMPNANTDTGDLLTHLLERSGVLREPIPGRVNFVHRTFQEYLAGDEAIQQHHVDTLINFAHMDTWRETIVLAAGHATTTQANALLTGILDRADSERGRSRKLRLVAAAALETINDLDHNVRERVDTMVRTTLVPPRSEREAITLASLGPRLLTYLPTTLEKLSDARAKATVLAVRRIGTSDVLPRLANYMHDRRYAIRGIIGSSLPYFESEAFVAHVLDKAPPKTIFLTISKPSDIGILARSGFLGTIYLLADFPGPITDLSAFRNISNIKSLTLLSFAGQTVKLGDLSPRLKMLNLAVSGDIPQIESHPQRSSLKALGVLGNSLQNFDKLPQSSGIERLVIDSVFPHARLDGIARMQSLKQVHLVFDDVDATERIDLSTLSALPELETVYVSACTRVEADDLEKRGVTVIKREWPLASGLSWSG